MGKQPPELMPPDLPSHVYAYTRIYVCIFTGMQSLNTVALKDYFRALSRRVKGECWHTATSCRCYRSPDKMHARKGKMFPFCYMNTLPESHTSPILGRTQIKASGMH